MKLKAWESADHGEPIYQAETVINDELPLPMAKRHFIDLCGGDEVAAHMLFNRCEWQEPASVLESEGGLERFIYADPQAIKLAYGTPETVFNRVTIKGRDQVEVVFPGGLDYAIRSDGEAFAPVHREIVRGWFQEGFKGVAGAAPDGSLVVVFSPLSTPSKDFAVKLEAGRITAQAGQPNRASIFCDRLPDSFSMRAMHLVFSHTFGSSFTTIDITRKPGIDADKKIALLHDEFSEQVAKFEEGDPRLPLARADFFRKHYGAEKAMLSMNRGYAYVGPVIHETRFHYFQLDKVSNEVAIHYKGHIEGDLVIGADYSVMNEGGVRSAVKPLPAVVADAIARDIRYTKQVAQETRSYPPASLMKAAISKVDVIPVQGERPSLIGFHVGQIRVGEGDGEEGWLAPTPISERDAKALAEQGVGIEYVAGDFFVGADELRLAAYEKIGWFQPEKIIGPHTVSAWIQTAWIKNIPAHTAEPQ